MSTVSVMPKSDPRMEPEVETPAIVVSDEEASQIIQELNLLEIEPTKGTSKDKRASIDVRKLLRLGIFAEHVGGVRLRGGTLLASEQFVLNHMQRLNAVAAEMTSAEELKEIAYPLAVLHSAISKGAQKAKVVVEYVAEKSGSPRGNESWAPGQKVLPVQDVA